MDVRNPDGSQTGNAFARLCHSLSQFACQLASWDRSVILTSVKTSGQATNGRMDRPTETRIAMQTGLLLSIAHYVISIAEDKDRRTTWPSPSPTPRVLKKTENSITQSCGRTNTSADIVGQLLGTVPRVDALWNGGGLPKEFKSLIT